MLNMDKKEKEVESMDANTTTESIIMDSEDKEYSVNYKSYYTDLHGINARIDEDGFDTAERAIDLIEKKKKINETSKENEKSMWIQKKMNSTHNDPINGEQWYASFNALRIAITGKTHEQAMDEATKKDSEQKKIDEFAEKKEESET